MKRICVQPSALAIASGMEPAPMTPAKSTAYFKAARERWNKMIRDNNIRAE